ncbi:YaiI/YqxD family protein [Planomicrobium sp. YIM 101495]|uniref:YaiI/YqxD family protein n=1 Tax=Planomicrobium sp. YIM 101495 TaxID=2665160 RepID=UPI0012B6C13E|nr:YaiI/YqxD family protein [Planomicrobium sp. YIM 101495]MTD31462.1 YaiI/YqxD family protein [Planomicrobium sp. YIM 101495]
MVKLLVDADGCPVVNEAIAKAQKYNVPVLLLCDTSHEMQREGAETIVVSKGADSADFALVNRVGKGDIVVTQDYGLAAMVLAKRGVPIDQNGRVYTDDNIGSLLGSRHVAKKIRQGGGRLKGPKKRRPEQNERFEESLEGLLKKL